MSKQDLLSAYADQLAPRKTIFHGSENGVARVEMRQEVSAILEAAKIVGDQQVVGGKVRDETGLEMRHVAFIPEATLNQAMVEGWFHDESAWKAWANNPENRGFRTWQGRI